MGEKSAEAIIKHGLLLWGSEMSVRQLIAKRFVSYFSQIFNKYIDKQVILW